MGALVEAAKRNDKRGILEALRDEIALSIENTRSGRDVAALSKRLVEICAAIEALAKEDGTNPVDEMARLVSEYDDYDGEDD